MTSETGGADGTGSWMTDEAGARSVTGECRFRPQRPHARPASLASHASHPSPQCTAIKLPSDPRAHACNHLFIAASVEVRHFNSPSYFTTGTFGTIWLLHLSNISPSQPPKLKQPHTLTPHLISQTFLTSKVPTKNPPSSSLLSMINTFSLLKHVKQGRWLIWSL